MYNFTTIDAPGATLTLARGINDAGQIVGRFDDATFGKHSFLKNGATFTPIDVPGATSSQANGINNAGQIVGDFVTASNVHGFLKDGATFTTIDVPGATSSQANGINNAGQIVGDFGDVTGTHGFVATPVPEPATWLLFASGLVGLVLWQKGPAWTKQSCFMHRA
jgi:probable HAF family extracellular repeat protein